jgi:hypothetical protein
MATKKMEEITGFKFKTARSGLEGGGARPTISDGAVRSIGIPFAGVVASIRAEE